VAAHSQILALKNGLPEVKSLGATGTPFAENPAQCGHDAAMRTAECAMLARSGQRGCPELGQTQLGGPKG